MARILVTGAGGFVGAAAVRALLGSGHEVVAIVRSETSGARLSTVPVRQVVVDLEDRPHVAQAIADVRPEVILHAAWYANPKDYLTSSMSLASLRTTIDLVRAALSGGCRRFVGVGTCLEYAGSSRPLAEGDPCEPRTLYASCKLSAWLLSRALAAGASADVQPSSQCRSGRDCPPISLVWARLFNLYGADENPGRLLPSLLSALQARRRFPMSSGEQVRDYLHVEDAGRALALLCDHSIEGVVNVASGQAIAVRDFASTVAGLVGAENSLLGLGDLPGRMDEDGFVVGDAGRLRALGFTPRYATLAEGVLQVLQTRHV